VSVLFLRKSARHSKDFFKTGPFQGFTSKESGPSLIDQAKLGKRGGLRVQPSNAQELVDAGPTGFPSNVTTSRGSWPGPRIEAERGAASATLDPNRIGQTSRIPIETTLCI
jgi:hypothetical protein